MLSSDVRKREWREGSFTRTKDCVWIHGRMKLHGIYMWLGHWDGVLRFFKRSLSLRSVLFHSLLYTSISSFWLTVLTFNWKVRGKHCWRPKSIRFLPRTSVTRDSFHVSSVGDQSLDHVSGPVTLSWMMVLIILRLFSATLWISVLNLILPGRIWVAFIPPDKEPPDTFLFCFNY